MDRSPLEANTKINNVQIYYMNREDSAKMIILGGRRSPDEEKRPASAEGSFHPLAKKKRGRLMNNAGVKAG